MSPVARCCGFCGQNREATRLIGGHSGAVICDDCAALATMVFTTRRAEAEDLARRAADTSATRNAWGVRPMAPAGVPIIVIQEPRA